MRLLALLIFVFAASISLFAASKGSQLDRPPVSASPVFKVGSLSLSPAGNAKPLFLWPTHDRHWVTERSLESTTCYKMRAYYVVRDSRNPDVTRPDGYSTCQPAARFQVKRAIGTEAEEKMSEDTPAEQKAVVPQ